MNIASNIEIMMRLRGSEDVTSGIANVVASTDKLDRASYRVQSRFSGMALGAAGIDGPITNLIHRFEYLQFMADRMDTSIGQMAVKFGPMVGAVGLATASIKILWSEVSGFAASGKQEFIDAGLGVHSFFENFKLGMGWIDITNQKLENTAELLQRMKDWSSHHATAGQNAWDLSQTTDRPLTVFTQRSAELKAGLDRQLGERESRVKELEAERDKYAGMGTFSSYQNYKEIEDVYSTLTGEKRSAVAAPARAEMLVEIQKRLNEKIGEQNQQIKEATLKYGDLTDEARARYEIEEKKEQQAKKRNVIRQQDNDAYVKFSTDLDQRNEKARITGKTDVVAELAERALRAKNLGLGGPDAEIGKMLESPDETVRQRGMWMLERGSDKVQEQAKKLFSEQEGVRNKWLDLAQSGGKFAEFNTVGSVEAYKAVQQQTAGNDMKENSRQQLAELVKLSRTQDEILRTLSRAQKIAVVSMAGN